MPSGVPFCGRASWACGLALPSGCCSPGFGFRPRTPPLSFWLAVGRVSLAQPEWLPSRHAIWPPPPLWSPLCRLIIFLLRRLAACLHAVPNPPHTNQPTQSMPTQLNQWGGRGIARLVVVGGAFGLSHARPCSKRAHTSSSFISLRSQPSQPMRWHPAGRLDGLN